jgi:hypothetical protein
VAGKVLSFAFPARVGESAAPAALRLIFDSAICKWLIGNSNQRRGRCWLGRARVRKKKPASPLTPSPVLKTERMRSNRQWTRSSGRSKRPASNLQMANSLAYVLPRPLQRAPRNPPVRQIRGLPRKQLATKPRRRPRRNDRSAPPDRSARHRPVRSWPVAAWLPMTKDPSLCPICNHPRL